jgi:3-deoxy-D-manno-octulosonate 8-phosphate phosphatase (KDO 8-P phosphatase)
MKLATIASCPQDACIDVRNIAHYISPYPGGKGAVRDIIEKVMKLRGDWE